MTRFEGIPFTVCRPDAKKQRLQLVSFDKQGKPLRDFSRLQLMLGAEQQAMAFAMNAGMYDMQGQPIGLYVAAGKTIHAINQQEGSGNFHLKPNGVFWVDRDGAHVAETARFVGLRPTNVELATQSGPMLVIDGTIHPAISPNGSSRYVRNGVGIGPSGQPIFAISQQPVSFGQFARFFRDGLGCKNALYLDGLVSALWDGPSGQNNQTVSLGPMIVALEASPLPAMADLP